MKLETGRVVAGRYKIDEQLGMGGMAVVYRAKDLRLDRFVTLKVLRDDYTADEEFIGRFNIEARAAASLQNPNIVSIYDSGQDGDIYYIVFEYVNGSTLKELIARKAPFDNKTTLGVSIQIAGGLADAHQHNIIHRDIKPQNILVTTDHSVKITDFGIARAAKSATLDGSTDMMGSAHYFSPEQARGGYIDLKSDIYSLGIVMFEMATGRVPFEDDAVVAIALKHINEPLPDISAINPGVTESIIRIIKKATEKSASRRYATVAEMADDLKRALTDESGAFVENPKDYKDSPTKSITNEDLNEIKRVKHEKQQEELTEEYDEEEEYEDEDEYDDDYEEDYVDEYEYEDDRYYKGKDKPNKKKERLVILAAVVTALIFIGLISWGAWTILSDSLPKQVDVPKLTDMTLAEAEAAADEVNLNVLPNEVYNEAEAGTVIEQAELPGETLTEGNVIHVTVSLGPKSVTLPDVTTVEMTIDEARELFEGLDVEINEVAYDDEESPAGLVVSQNPEPGAEVPPGSTVDLFVSTGPDTSMTEVPLILGETEASAILLLEAAGLIPGLSEKAESIYKEGTVCDQEIDPFTKVERGQVVGYTVSIGTAVATDPPRTPTPEPEPTPEPTPEPADVTAGPSERVLLINLWSVLEGTETVNVTIVQIDGSGTPVTVYDNIPIPVSSFPIQVPVSGTGVEVFYIYDGLNMVATEQVDFGTPIG